MEHEIVYGIIRKKKWDQKYKTQKLFKIKSGIYHMLALRKKEQEKFRKMKEN